MPNYNDLWHRASDGLRLYARDYPCRREGSAKSPTVLCMHGLTRNSTDFADLADHLSGDHRVISVDQRGRGKSGYDPVVANYSPVTYVQDMFALLDTQKIQKVVLLGTSMGGLMSFLMCAMQPERVLAAVINDIGPEVDPKGLARIKSYVGKSAPVSSWDEAVAQAREVNGAQFPDFSPGQWLDFTQGLYRDEDGVPVLAYDPAIAQPLADTQSGAVPPDLWSVFDACLDIPMLLIRGAHSDILSEDCVRHMQSRKSDLQYAEIPHRGHAPTLNEPEARCAIDEFIKGLHIGV